MPLMPKRTKHRKMQKGRNRGKATRGNVVNEGDYGLQATTAGWIKSNQIEAARVAMTRYIKRGGKVWIKIFPDKPVTKKPAETRMGKGKGAPEFWVAVVKPGRILLELADVTEDIAKEALRLAAQKLPVQAKFVVREGLVKEEADARARMAMANAVVIEEVKESKASEEAVSEDAGAEKVGGDKNEE